MVGAADQANTSAWPTGPAARAVEAGQPFRHRIDVEQLIGFRIEQEQGVSCFVERACPSPGMLSMFMAALVANRPAPRAKMAAKQPPRPGAVVVPCIEANLPTRMDAIKNRGGKQENCSEEGAF